MLYRPSETSKLNQYLAAPAFLGAHLGTWLAGLFLVSVIPLLLKIEFRVILARVLLALVKILDSVMPADERAQFAPEPSSMTCHDVS